MKKIFKPVLALGLIALFLQGCAKNDDFSVPGTDCIETDVKANYALPDFVSSLSKNMEEYSQDHIISGYVISNSIGGNFYRQLFIVDKNNENPVLFSADINNSYVNYPVGTKIFLKVKGTYSVINNEVATIGALNGTRPYPTFIGSPTYNQHIVKSCERLTDSELKALPLEVTLDQAIEKDNIGKLITISDVQFGPDSRNQTYYNEDNKAGTSEATNNIIQGKGSSAVVVYRAAKQANGFANEIVPANSGSMTGIMTKFNDDFQFVPRTLADLNLDQPLFENEAGPGPGKEEGVGVDGVDIKQPTFVANFADWDNFIKTTNRFGKPDYANSAPDKGPDGKGAMWIYGTPPGNAYIFTTENQTVVKGATAIKLKVKGTAGKSLSFNIYDTNGKLHVFNLRTDDEINGDTSVVVKDDRTLTATKRLDDKGNPQNDYIKTSIVSSDKWITLTLDLQGLDYNTTGKGNLFAFKVGSKAMYDLVVSPIEFVGGSTDPVDPVEPDDPKPTEAVNATNFSNWAEFVSSTSQGIKHITESSVKGPNGEGTALLKIDAAPGNDFLFTTKTGLVPAGKTQLVFYIKGTSAKSLSINLYNGEPQNSFAAFNLGSNLDANGVASTAITKDQADMNNQYIGQLDTKGDWLKITINLKDKDGAPIVYNTTEGANFLGLKLGSKSAFDLLISDFMFQ